jgi:Cys-tRNA(Pro)/Cys-tRNA(Cys) deacylase
MSKKTNAARYLDTLKIKYELVSYEVDEDDLSAVHVADTIGADPAEIFKTLVVTDEQGVPIVACIPADAELDLKALAVAAGRKRCDMLPVKELLATTGYIRGGCSPLGMKKRFATFIDQNIENVQKVYVSAGQKGLQLLLPPQDLVRASNAQIARLTTNNKH